MNRFFFSLILGVFFASNLFGQMTVRSYDSLGRLTYVRYPDSSLLTYTYDRGGNLIGQVINDPCSTKPRPIIVASGPLTFCNGDSVWLSVSSSGLKLLWSTGDTTHTSICITSAGTYAAARIDTFPIPGGDTLQCYLVSDSVRITVNPIPLASAMPGSQGICNGATTTIVNFNSTVPGTIFNWVNSLTDIGLTPISDTGNIPAFVVSNVSYLPITDTITVNPSANGCAGAPINVFITANPIPNESIPGNQVYCNNTATDTFHFYSSAVGTTYIWSNTNPVIGLDTGGTGDIPPFTATDTSSLTASTIITVLPTAYGCIGTGQFFSITVNPTTADLDSVMSQTVCNADFTLPINFTSLSSGTTYTWINDDTAIGLPPNGTGEINTFRAINNSDSADTAHITVTPFANGCPGNSQRFSIIVNPTPGVSVTMPVPYCNGSVTTPVFFTNTVAGTINSWTNSDTAIGLSGTGTGNVPIFTATNTTSAVDTANIIVLPSANGCMGIAQSFQIVVKPTNADVIVTPAFQILCNHTLTDTIRFGSTTSGTTYAWANNNTTVGLDSIGMSDMVAFTANNTTPFFDTATVTVTPTANGCTGTPQLFTVIVKPTPQVDSLLNQTVCNGDTINAIHFHSSVTGSAFNWSNNNTIIGCVAAGTGDIPTFTAINRSSVPDSAVFVVTPSANGCSGPSDSFTLLVNPTPTEDSIASQTLCNGASITTVHFTGSVLSTEYSWSNDDNTIGLPSRDTGDIMPFTVFNSRTLPDSAHITVTPFGNGCTGLSRSFYIRVNPTPLLNSTLSPAAICDANPFLYLPGSYTPGATFAWSRDTLAGIANPFAEGDSFVNEILVNATPDTVGVNYLYVISANGCSDTERVRVIVKPKPLLNIPLSQPPICDSTLFHCLPVSRTVGTAYEWSRSAITGITNPATVGIDSIHETLVNATSDTVAVRYTIVLTAQACSDTETLQVIVNPKPLLSSTQFPAAICDSTFFHYIPQSLTSGTTYAWMRGSVPGISSLPAAGVDTVEELLVNTKPDTVGVAHSIILTANGCSDTETVRVIVNPLPRLSSRDSASICSGAQFSYLQASETPRTTFNWYRPTVPGVTPTGTKGYGNISETLFNTTVFPVNVVYIDTLFANGCFAIQNIYLTVNPFPDTPLIYVKCPAFVCANTQFQNVGAYTPEPAGVNYTWSVTNGSIWAVGAHQQYILVNFPNSGESMIELTATFPGADCPSADRYLVIVGEDMSPAISMTYANGDFVCESNDQDTYQWGYDDAVTLDSTILPFETNQNYFNSDPDFADRYYWVITTKNGCLQKTYYNLPPPLSSVNEVGDYRIKIYPNPADNMLKVEMSGVQGGNVNLIIYDVLGKAHIVENMQNANMVNIDISTLADGAYFIECYESGLRLATAKFIKFSK